VVLSIVPVMYNTILALHQSDGSIEFRNTVTMEQIHADYSTDKVTSLPQAGFAFLIEEAPLYVALSANCCLAATMGCDGAVKIKTMAYVHGSLSTVDDDAKHEAAIAALALQHTSSCNQYFSGDDIFAIIPEDLASARVYYLLNLLFHSMSVNIDCVGHNPQESICAGLGKNPAFVRCLSAQNTLGYISNNIRRLPASLAWATLNIRHISIITLLVFNYHRGKPQQGQPPGQLSLLRPGILQWIHSCRLFNCLLLPQKWLRP
jgi:mediator of RNA polymerase II transcription subunit 16, fungi type